MNYDKIIAKSKDVMHELEKQICMTIAIGTIKPNSGFGIVLDSIDGTSGFSFHIEPMHEFHLHTAAPAKAMMAYFSKEERNEIYKHMNFKQFTNGTITNSDQFEKELQAVLEKGYGIDVSERMEGCHCVAVPIFDSEHRPIAAIWGSTLAQQLPVHKFSEVANHLKKSAAEISKRVNNNTRSANRNYIYSIIEQSKDIIQKNLNKNIDIEQLAKNLYVSYSWFRQAFKDQTGEAPAQYHQNLRIKKAEEMLTKSDLSIRQISEELGFQNQNHFSALFKRKTGVSPNAYRIREMENAELDA